MAKGKNNDLLNTTQQTKDWATRTSQQKTGCSGMASVVLLVTNQMTSWKRGKKNGMVTMRNTTDVQYNLNQLGSLPECSHKILC